MDKAYQEAVALNDECRALTKELTRNLKAPLTIDLRRWGLKQWDETWRGVCDLTLVPGKVPDLSWEARTPKGVGRPMCEEIRFTYDLDALKNAVLQQATVMGVEL